MTEEVQTTAEAPVVDAKPKKKRVNSKAKGSGFEGHVGKVLAETLPPLKFRRSQSSGAILGGRNQKFMENYSEDAKVLFVGDVVPTNESDVFREHGWKFKYALECKFYKNCDTLDHLFNNTRIKGWFKQALEDSAKISKEPLLIFKFNHTDIFCATDMSQSNVLPSTLSKSMTLDFGKDEPKLNVFLFKEALLDLEWWKTR